MIVTVVELEVLAKLTTNCYFCDKPLNWFVGGKGSGPWQDSPTLERLNMEVQVRLDNIKIICHQCNSSKRNRTMKEFVEYCEMITKRFGSKVAASAAAPAPAA
jgi:hypothetical protein